MVKPFFEEENAYSIKQFEGKELLLPKQKGYYPLVENLRSHRERFGFDGRQLKANEARKFFLYSTSYFKIS